MNSKGSEGEKPLGQSRPPKVNVIRRPKHPREGSLEDWRHIWLDAVKKQPHSYFLSWPWLKHWLDKLPLEVELNLVQVEVDSSRAVCLMGHDRKTRHGFIYSDSYYLHYTGLAPFDNLTLEYNQVPARNPGPQLLQALLSALPKGWDELHLPALDATRFPANCLGQPLAGLKVITYRQLPSHYVDLSAIGETQDSYTMLLSQNTRSNIRQAIKRLSKLGPLRLIPACDPETALAVYVDLVGMHQESWKKRGLPGAFATDWFEDFHRSLIESRFTAGEMQLLRINCGEKTLGCLYNFVYQGVVYYYQSGFNYADFGRFKPGLVCHALAIPYNAALGHKTYDFLGGDSQYKKSLSTHTNQLVSYIIQKPRLRFKLERLAKATKALLREQKSNARRRAGRLTC